jgi:hypothetical protein
MVYSLEFVAFKFIATQLLYGEFEDGTTGKSKLDYSFIVWRDRGWNNRDDEA